MKRFARIVNDRAIDVHDAESREVAAARFGGIFGADEFAEVPADTAHGAILTVESGTVRSAANPEPLAVSDADRRIAEIKAELRATDEKLDRDREDQWLALQKIADAAGAGNVIPAAKQKIIDRKNELRDELAEIGGE